LRKSVWYATIKAFHSNGELDSFDSFIRLNHVIFIKNKDSHLFNNNRDAAGFVQSKHNSIMAQAAIDRDDYTHPEKIYKDLTYEPHNDPDTSAKNYEARKHLKTCFSLPFDYPREEEELCWNCGWSVYHEVYASYGSRIRIFHTRGNIGIWQLGSKWLVRDQPNDTSLGNDFITQEFLRNQGLDIPLVKEMRQLNAPTDKIALTLMSRAQGVGLDKIWHTLSSEQRSNLKNQLGEAITQWRQLTSPVAKKVDGGLMDDCLIGNCLRRRAPTCRKVGRKTDEWLENLEEDLRFGISLLHKTKDPMVIEAKFQEMKRNFPKSDPYVLTHGDLNFTNIIVKDNKIEAIIDWEHSGYLPWWAERWLSLIGGNDLSDQLFEPLWADFGLEMDTDTFQKEIIDRVAPVVGAWDACRYYVDHPSSKAGWLRPGFCKCKPFAGDFRWTEIGNQVEHHLKDTWVG